MCVLLQRSAWPRGMVLGGSSSLNNLQYVRGSRHDYDRWAKEGCKGWSYKDVLPYFIMSEDIQIPELQNSGKNIRFVHQIFFLWFFLENFWVNIKFCLPLSISQRGISCEVKYKIRIISLCNLSEPSDGSDFEQLIYVAFNCFYTGNCRFLSALKRY